MQRPKEWSPSSKARSPRAFPSTASDRRVRSAGCNKEGSRAHGYLRAGHLGAGGASGTQAALTLLATAASEVAVTELDIANAASSDYLAVMNACLAVSKCVGITVRALFLLACTDGLTYCVSVSVLL